MPTSLDEHPDLNTLLAAARQAADRALVPHSRFRVGCALITASGTVVTGCNIESASYGLTICAERCAIFTAIAAGGRHIIDLAVSCPDIADADLAASPDLSMPCGACRQVIAEHTDAGARIAIDRVGVFTIEELLPRPFNLPTTP